MNETPTVIPAGLLKRLHVDQHRIRSNHKDGSDLPVLTIQARGGPYGAHEVLVDGPSRFVYREENPLSCGARVFVETTAEVTTILREQ